MLRAAGIEFFEVPSLDRRQRGTSFKERGGSHFRVDLLVPVPNVLRFTSSLFFSLGTKAAASQKRISFKRRHCSKHLWSATLVRLKTLNRLLQGAPCVIWPRQYKVT
jgi:hypothetical protein